jgi:hypothetical protein
MIRPSSGLAALLAVILSCSGSRVVETRLIQRKTESEFAIYHDSLEVGRRTTELKELRQGTRYFEEYEFRQTVTLGVEERPVEYSMEGRYRSTDDGVPISVDLRITGKGDTLRITGACEGNTCRFVVVDSGRVSERIVQIGADVRFRLPFERWAFRDRLRVGASFHVELLRPEIQEVVQEEAQVTALDTLNVQGKVLELYRVRVMRIEGETPEVFWVDAFGDLWKAEIRIRGADVTMERTRSSRGGPGF